MNTNNKQLYGRLAPSPTGYLHLGNAWSFLLAWLSIRLANGKIFLRIEDIDPQRSKPEFVQGILDDFAWLGIDYDEKIIFQSQRFPLYQKYCSKLSALIYPCYCTRKELRDLAGAPQIKNPLTKTRFIMPDMGVNYPRTCRFLPKEQQHNKNACLRLACPPFEKQEHIPQCFLHLSEILSFNDLILSKQQFNLNECGGDFAIQRSDGVWSYQLAVSIDDMEMGINHIVRGEDILTSTPRQLYLFQLLHYQAPQYAHIPLLLNENGERLAKRHASLSLKAIRENNPNPENLISFLAHLMGFTGKFSSAPDLLHHLQQKKLSSFPFENLRQYHNGIITSFS